MNIGDIAANVGLTKRVWDEMDRVKSATADAASARKYGLDAMRDEADMRPSEMGLRRNEIDFRKLQIENQKTLLPKQTNVAGRQLDAQGTQADAVVATVPGAAEAEVAAQRDAKEDRPTVRKLQKGELVHQEQSSNLRAVADAWRTFTSQGKGPTIALLNKTNMMGAEVSDIVEGDLVDEATGKAEPHVAIHFKDGRQPAMIPRANLDGAVNTIYSQVHKVGSSIVVQRPNGKFDTAFTEPEFGVNPETGEIFDKRNGPATVAGSAASKGVGGNKREREREKFIQESTKMAIDKVLLPRYGGRFEGMTYFPDEKNKDVSLEVTARVEELIREADARGAPHTPTKFAQQAVDEIERKRAAGAVGSGDQGAASKIEAIGKKFGF